MSGFLYGQNLWKIFHTAFPVSLWKDHSEVVWDLATSVSLLLWVLRFCSSAVETRLESLYSTISLYLSLNIKNISITFNICNHDTYISAGRSVSVLLSATAHAAPAAGKYLPSFTLHFQALCKTTTVRLSARLLSVSCCGGFVDPLLKQQCSYYYRK